MSINHYEQQLACLEPYQNLSEAQYEINRGAKVRNANRHKKFFTSIIETYLFFPASPGICVWQTGEFIQAAWLYE